MYGTLVGWFVTGHNAFEHVAIELDIMAARYLLRKIEFELCPYGFNTNILAGPNHKSN